MPLQIYARSEPGEPPEYCTLFNHMVKSGGSTIKSKLFDASSADGVSLPGLSFFIFPPSFISGGRVFVTSRFLFARDAF